MKGIGKSKSKAAPKGWEKGAKIGSRAEPWEYGGKEWQAGGLYGEEAGEWEQAPLETSMLVQDESHYQEEVHEAAGSAVYEDGGWSQEHGGSTGSDWRQAPRRASAKSGQWHSRSPPAPQNGSADDAFDLMDQLQDDADADAEGDAIESDVPSVAGAPMPPAAPIAADLRLLRPKFGGAPPAAPIGRRPPVRPSSSASVEPPSPEAPGVPKAFAVGGRMPSSSTGSTTLIRPRSSIRQQPY